MFVAMKNPIVKLFKDLAKFLHVKKGSSVVSYFLMWYHSQAEFFWEFRLFRTCCR